MTEWDAAGYDRRSGLQRAMATEVLSLLSLQGTECILDVGCGQGRVTAELAERVPQGRVFGVDISSTMIDFASLHYGPKIQPNLRFQVADARHLNFFEEFDLVVSLNALHWVPEQDQALGSIYRALKPGGVAQLRLVPAGPRQSLEETIEKVRSSERWRQRFAHSFTDPYLHLTPEEYAVTAERSGFRVYRIHTADNAWNFQSRSQFHAFCSVMLMAWTQFLPLGEAEEFVEDTLSHYEKVVGVEGLFRFYQMDVRLNRPV